MNTIIKLVYVDNTNYKPNEMNMNISECMKDILILQIYY